MGKVETAVEVASSLPGLMLEAERVAQGFMRGVHGRRKAGSGESFWQFREWQAGDSASAIDWRKSAKSDELMVKEREWDAAQSLWIYRDNSQSMHFASSLKYQTKARYSEIMLLSLATVALNGGERVGLLGAGLPLQTGSAAVNRIYGGLARQTLMADITEIKNSSHVVVFSDFFTRWEENKLYMQALAEKHVKGLLVMVNDKAEETFPYKGYIKFRPILDKSDGEIVSRKAEDMAEDYKHRFSEYRAMVADFAIKIGWDCIFSTTDKRPEELLLNIYDLLAVKK